MMSARLSARSTAKMVAEKRLVRLRDRENDYRTAWDNQARYYKTWEKKNSHYEEWTSPRYYEANNQTIEAHKKQREHQKNLEARREKLRTLLAEEKRTHDIEMMVKSRYTYQQPAVPTEALKNINVGIKIAEEDRRRHEAELGLYNHWRNNNPIVREHERAINDRNLKLSWLDQQIEKRVQREKDEEECRKILAERNKRIEEEKRRDDEIKQEVAEKQHKLRADLEQQMKELQLKQDESDKLRHDEDEHTMKLAELAEALQQQEEVKRQRSERELAIENLKQHKLKLKQKAMDVRNNLEQERDFVQKLIRTDVMEKIEDEAKRHELQKTMKEFLKYTRDQHELERKREEYFSFVFDSEAKSAYQKQQQVWLDEQNARTALLHDVLHSIKEQIQEKVRLTKQKQLATLQERQDILKRVEDYESDMNKIKLSEQRKREEWKKNIEEQIREKKARERATQLQQEKEIDFQIEAAKKEEERLRQEIAKLQQRCGPIRPTRSRILF